MGDRELVARLDDPDGWLVLDSMGTPLATSLTLRHALHQVQLLLSGGVMAGSMVRDAGPRLVVPMDQIYRMCSVAWD